MIILCSSNCLLNVCVCEQRLESFANVVREGSFSSEQQVITGKSTRESDCRVLNNKGDICTTLSKNERTMWKREGKRGQEDGNVIVCLVGTT